MTSPPRTLEATLNIELLVSFNGAHLFPVLFLPLRRSAGFLWRSACLHGLQLLFRPFIFLSRASFCLTLSLAKKKKDPLTPNCQNALRWSVGLNSLWQGQWQVAENRKSPMTNCMALTPNKNFQPLLAEVKRVWMDHSGGENNNKLKEAWALFHREKMPKKSNFRQEQESLSNLATRICLSEDQATTSVVIATFTACGKNRSGFMEC